MSRAKISNTFSQYINANLCCFIPGKIIDEIYNIFNILRNQEIPNRNQLKVIKELRDMSSLAKGHFEAEIMPGMKKRLQTYQNKGSLERKQNKRIETLERTVAAQAKMLKEIQNERIEKLERTVAAQATLISSQAEMLKEMNKKLLDSEQKTATLFEITKGLRVADEDKQCSKKRKSSN